MVRGEQRRFELGQTTNDDVLRAQETLAQAERDYIKALLNFNLALVSLERAKGTLLETQGVEVFQPEAPADHPRPLGLRPAAGAAK
jgi:outer membrane protein TolC